MMAALEAAFQTNTPTIINSYPTQLLEPRPIFLHQAKDDVLRNILHESAGTQEYDIVKPYTLWTQKFGQSSNQQYKEKAPEQDSLPITVLKACKD